MLFFGFRTTTLFFAAMLAVPHAFAFAAEVKWAGTITTITVDSGNAVFSDTLGDFSGRFGYGDVCLVGCTVHTEPNEADYEFIGTPFVWQTTDSSATVDGTTVSINIQDDMPLTVEEAELASQLLASSVAPGTLVDVWTARGISVGAFEEDVTPNDDNDDETLFNGHVVEIALLSFDTSLFPNLGLQATPPDLADVDLAVFLVQEADGQGNTTYDAIGVLTQVPEPSSGFLLLAGLLAIRRLRHAGRRQETPDRVAQSDLV